MITLVDDIQNLDRMVDCGAAKDEIRAQIRLIAREVAALQAENASIAEDNAKLKDALAKYKARDDTEAADLARRAQAVYLDREQ